MTPKEPLGSNETKSKYYEYMSMNPTCSSSVSPTVGKLVTIRELAALSHPDPKADGLPVSYNIAPSQKVGLAHTRGDGGYGGFIS